ncbi:MAG: hypothetical protein PHC51_09035 [bacterium]|nr:hypothetical protein [bacterium]
MHNLDHLKGVLARAAMSKDVPYLMMVGHPTIEAGLLPSIFEKMSTSNVVDGPLNHHLETLPGAFEALAVSSTRNEQNNLCPDQVKDAVVNCFANYVQDSQASQETLWLGVFSRDIKRSPVLDDRNEVLQIWVLDYLKSQGFTLQHLEEGIRLPGKTEGTHSLGCYTLVR